MDSKNTLKFDEKSALLGLCTTKYDDFSSWYTHVVTRAELIDNTDVSGCYVIRPWAYAIWEFVQHWFDSEIKKLGVKNSYFPLFASQRAITKANKDHTSKMVWVTKSGDSDLKEPIAVRPKSESVAYPLYAKWIRSHRDLPLKLNQWNNVVRFEDKNPIPFLRSSEFLWQEGHTAFATKLEAEREVLQILNLYESVYEMFALPVFTGKKTELKKFAGALFSTTIEAFIPAVGRVIEGATTHCLGQHFAQMYGIEFENTEGKKSRPWQNCWSFSTRAIGVMVMIHSDHKGLVVPPLVAHVQVVIVPSLSDKNTRKVLKDKSNELAATLKTCGVRVEVDDAMVPKGNDWEMVHKWKNWEMKGVPILVELGPQDMDTQSVVVVDRQYGKRNVMQWKELASRLTAMLHDWQRELLINARAKLEAHRKQVTKWDDFVAVLDGGNVALVPFCGSELCEKNIKTRSGEWTKKNENGEVSDSSNGAVNIADKTTTGQVENSMVAALTNMKSSDKRAENTSAESICIPFDQPNLPAGTICIGCEAVATTWCFFGRRY